MCTDSWDHQPIIERIARTLQHRGYNVWLDIDMMQGSTMDAMSNAVDEADVMLYSVSLGCKCNGHPIAHECHISSFHGFLGISA